MTPRRPSEQSSDPGSNRSSDSRKPRQVGLDLLRFVAIFLVLGRHLWTPPAGMPDGWQSTLLAWQRGGWIGVDLFFVLSGFLVSGLLFSEFKLHDKVSPARFYTRRAWKIYPPFLVVIGVTVLLHLIYNVPIPRSSLLSELLFLQSYVPGLWGHTWSLAVEEHFYLVLPLIVLLTLQINRGSPKPLKPILGLAGATALLSLFARILNAWENPSYSHLTHLFPSHLRLDSLFFGVALAYVYHFHQARFVATLAPWRMALITGGVALLTPPFLVSLETSPFAFTVGLTLLYVGSGMLLAGILLYNIPRSRPVLWLASLGAYSYSIYLWHLPVNVLGVPFIERLVGSPLGFGGRAGVYLVGSVLAGVLMARIVEVPALHLRDRLFPPRSRGPLDN